MGHVQIKLGRAAVIITLILAAGYLAIFFSILRSDAPKLSGRGKGLAASDKVSKSQLDRVLEEKDEINKELQLLKTQLKVVNKVKVAEAHTGAEESEKAASAAFPQVYRPGVIVLGMHRSGTSIIGGLMNKMGLNTGGPLIRPWHDNEKGFFERVDVVVQNDAIMKKQFIDYAQSTHRFNTLEGLKEVLAHLEPSGAGGWFNDGRNGLKFLNDPSSYPWMLKDPRLCITIRLWLPLLNFIPAVLFTYRHPMDVAMSMHKRETEHFRVQRGLKLWYIYNKRALQQSHDLCRVTTSHKKMMAAPQAELDRIYDELRGCGVPVPSRARLVDINDFIDPKLQHGRSALMDASCTKDRRMLTPDKDAWVPEDDTSLKLYQACMHLFCALEDGSAYAHDFTFDETVNDS